MAPCTARLDFNEPDMLQAANRNVPTIIVIENFRNFSPGAFTLQQLSADCQRFVPSRVKSNR